MWVGALITSVMLKTGTSVGTKYKPHEVYMGKLVLFNIMAILQTTVTLIGCFLLGIDISNPLMFILSCYFVSVVFMAIIYSLISLFGDVGKGIAILLLVFQISGSGGVYPVEIMNNIFRIIYPYLPMTHGITMVRESQLGLLWQNYLPSFVYLLIMCAIVVVASILLKQKWDKRTKFFEDKLEESNLFK
jgi:putative membrane protein